MYQRLTQSIVDARECTPAEVTKGRLGSMDYAFAPPVGSAGDLEGSFHALLAARPNTRLLEPSPPDPGSLRWFVKQGLEDPTVNDPMNPSSRIESLILASHANKTGMLAMPLTAKISDEINYDVLAKAYAEDPNVIRIPPTLFPATPDGGARLPLTVHIVGCSVGRAPEFLTLLQQGLGRVAITAPKYAHVAYAYPTPGGRVQMEYMAYEFWQYYRAPVPRATLVNDFSANAAHRLIDGSAIPKKMWENWVPNPMSRKGDEVPSFYPIAFDPAWNLDPPVHSLNRGRLFLYAEDVPVNRHIDGDGPKNSASAATKRDFVKRALLKDARYTDSHPYPVFRRFGFPTLDDMMNALDWVNTGGGDWVGKRIGYTITVPITDPANPKRLICNHYPPGGAPPHAGMSDSDGRLFARVEAPAP